MGPTKPQLGRAVTHPGPLGPARLSLLAFTLGLTKGYWQSPPSHSPNFSSNSNLTFPKSSLEPEPIFSSSWTGSCILILILRMLLLRMTSLLWSQSWSTHRTPQVSQEGPKTGGKWFIGFTDLTSAAREPQIQATVTLSNWRYSVTSYTWHCRRHFQEILSIYLILFVKNQ